MSRQVSSSIDVGTTATLVWYLTLEKLASLKKVWVHNTTVSSITFNFCKSDGTRLSPNIEVGAGVTRFISEEELPSLVFSEDIYAIASATGLQLMIEVEEI